MQFDVKYSIMTANCFSCTLVDLCVCVCLCNVREKNKSVQSLTPVPAYNNAPTERVIRDSGIRVNHFDSIRETDEYTVRQKSQEKKKKTNPHRHNHGSSNSCCYGAVISTSSFFPGK